MNICIFAKSLPVHTTGGMEIHVQSLVQGLINRNHKVTIITAPHPTGMDKCTTGNLTIYYLKSRPRITREKFYKESAKLFEILNKLDSFDILHSQSTLACGYAKYCKKNIPLVLTSHGTATSEIKTILKGRFAINSFLAMPIWLKIRFLDELAIYNKADKIIAVSTELSDDLKRQYTIPKERLIVIPNGVDIIKFKPISSDVLKRNLNIIDEKLIVSVGRIDEQKGFQLLIKALPEILKKFNVKLIIVGTGPYLRSLKSMAEKRGLQDRVVFVSRVSDEDLPKYYNLADVFAFPTLREESFGIVNIEAMACGKPVISSRIGGIPMVIDSGRDGILIEPGNLDELTKNILYLLGDEEFAKMLGIKAREKVVREFSLDKMVEDTIRVYECVLKSKST